ncbi:MAG: hypothetical protein NPMRTHETA2_320007 [Nitrosopumilales archaeon]|nr:MAG: hypothetical protein NPMRTHETA2_320007 [Nitrosopumilales archaeon]
MGKEQYETKTIVLKKRIDELIAADIIKEKKTTSFRGRLMRPKREEVHIHSIKLFYESVLSVSGKYVADFYRKATHTISVDSSVREIVLGDGIFPIRTKSGFAKAFSRKKAKNKVDMRLEEHVFIEEEGQIFFDHHGKEIHFPYKINSKTIENYPKRILQNNEPNVKRSELKHEAVIDKLSKKLKKPLDPDVRNLNDELIVNEINEIYVPVFEARLIGPKKKVGILRLDAVRKKIL